MNKDEINYMYVELGELPFDSAEEVARLRAALDNVNTPFEGRPFEDIYAAAERHAQDVLGLQAKYERYMEDVQVREKRARMALDKKLSGEKNPGTGKPYTRDAIAAVIEGSEEVADIVDYRLTAKSIINYLRKLYTLYELHYLRVENVNVNARRAWEHQQ